MDLKSEVGLLTLVANFGFQNGWMTEIENLQIKTKATLDLKKLAFFEVLTKAKYDGSAERLLCALRCVEEMKLENTTSCTDTLDEDYYLFMFMSKLYTKRLVTKKHKLFYENRLRQKMVKNNAAQKKELEKESSVLVKSDDPQIENKRYPVECLKNPMLIDLVIKCLMQYFNFEEVKSARHVSKVWSLVGLDILKIRSKIEFSLKTYSNYTDRSPLNFFSIFPIEKLENAHFANFSFGNQRKLQGISKTWSIKELNYFFQNYQKHIKELDIDIFQLVDENGDPYDSYHISPWLYNSAMTKPNTKFNTRLMIDKRHSQNYGKKATMTFVELSVLVNIKELRLWNCGVTIQEGVIICSPRIEIAGVCFHENGNMLAQVCLNDIIDFTKSKEVILTNWSTNATKMILDMDRNPETKLETLTLSNITLENLETCRWNVNHLHLNFTRFIESSDMQIRELTIKNNFSLWDISVLPRSIEKLTITDTSNCLCSQPIVLHNLKTLKFGKYYGDGILEFLNSQTIKCPQLVHLHLEFDLMVFDLLVRLDLAWIPPTLKTLKLKGIRINDEGIENILNLDTLLLEDYPIGDVGKVCGRKVRTKELILFYKPYSLLSLEVDHFLTFLNNNNIVHGLDQRIYVGNFEWNLIVQFEENPLRNYVDKKAEYYVFQNKVGKAIDVKEFELRK